MLCKGLTIPNFNPKKRQFLCNVTFYMYMYEILYKKYSKIWKYSVFVKVVLKGDNSNAFKDYFVP